LHPGKVASVHGPRFVPGQFSETLADSLLTAAIEAARALQVDIAQAVVDLAPMPEQAAWYRAGFHRAAELLFMSCEISGNVPAQRDSLRYSPCRFDDNQPNSPSNRRLADLVDATYAYSLDCPRLDGLRNATDVLAGYRATGHPDSSRWLLAYDATHSSASEPIGCLFVADHPGNNQCELVYMGIVPSHRGRGLGQALVSKALEISAELERARLVLAVDADNWPAFRHYAGMGFRTFARKQVFMLALDGRQSPRSR
jgi:ribosomal protein S18 acetylase RimI-like enzyme